MELPPAQGLVHTGVVPMGELEYAELFSKSGGGVSSYPQSPLRGTWISVQQDTAGIYH